MPKEVTAEAGAFLVYDTIKLGKHGRESCRLKPPRYVVGTSSISSDHSECSTSPSLVTSPGSKKNSRPCNDPRGGTTHAEAPQVHVQTADGAVPVHPHQAVTYMEIWNSVLYLTHNDPENPEIDELLRKLDAMDRGEII
jgi:hypothetical protein